jgi:hypothetical protein
MATFRNTLSKPFHRLMKMGQRDGTPRRKHTTFSTAKVCNQEYTPFLMFWFISEIILKSGKVQKYAHFVISHTSSFLYLYRTFTSLYRSYIKPVKCYISTVYIPQKRRTAICVKKWKLHTSGVTVWEQRNIRTNSCAKRFLVFLQTL